MLIPITSSCDAAGGLPEWAIVELQGDIKRRPEATDGPNGELNIGTLCTSVRTSWLCYREQHIHDVHYFARRQRRQ